MATYLEQSLAKLKEFEGCVPWMYRDTVGKITVGVGLMLPDAEAAQALPFTLGTSPATPEEIAAEYTRVDTLPLGRAPAFYKSPTALQLTQQTIDAKLTSVLEGFEADLRTQLPHYDTFPDTVKMALLDMIYNLGPAGLFKGFPHLIAAVDAGAWAEAAECCMRRGPSAARNAWTREQFLDAVVTTIKAETETWLKRIWGRIRQTLNVLFGRRP
ncbi:glycoside hydrolase family protein [Tunturiibacter lichenicola]|uniref:glycoside hydrolase family protein n=1 Tax=Tunturiibacter lichenicola TaxID=2051959 RepID=UPI003D9B5BBF